MYIQIMTSFSIFNRDQIMIFSKLLKSFENILNFFENIWKFFENVENAAFAQTGANAAFFIFFKHHISQMCQTVSLIR